MPSICRALLMLILLESSAITARAHFNMLIPNMASAKRSEPVVLVYRWGHPYEHQLFDAPTPASLVVFPPTGRAVNLDAQLKRATEPASVGKTAAIFQASFTPATRGDYIFLLTTQPIWMEEDQGFIQDAVKTVLHVQAQTGWDRTLNTGFEIAPLTRPYGLQPGMAFQAQVLKDGRPVPGVLVEIERYNATPPSHLPPDEHVTRTAKTDPNGTFVCTLTDPGWWGLTARRDAGHRLHDDKEFPLQQRATFWVYVDEYPSSKK